MVILWTAAAIAHPFDARWYGYQADVRLQAEQIDLEIAIEIPMLDLLSDMRRDFSDIKEPGPDDLEVFNARLHRELRDAMRLVVNEQPIAWDADAGSTEPRFENQFAIYTLNLSAGIPPESQTLNLINGAFPDAPSIFSTTVQVSHDIVVDACSLLDVDDGSIVASRDGQWRPEEESRELRLSFRTRTGLDATFSRGFQTITGTPADAMISAQDALSGVDTQEEPLQALVRGELTPQAIAWAFLLAVILGAFHALSPGHGKALVTAYLLGERQTIRHAVWLGVIVTITHTLGVYALGALALWFEDALPPERLLPWMTFGSGLLVLGVGASLFWTRMPRDNHDHDHDHDHDHSHGHAHNHEDVSAHGAAHAEAYVEHGGTWWGLVSLGVSGGLVPCPSALVLLLTAVSFHRTALGLALIVAFSSGLALVVTAVGVVAVVAGDRMRWRGEGSGTFQSALRWAPVVSAAVIAVLGVGILMRGIGEIAALGT